VAKKRKSAKPPGKMPVIVTVADEQLKDIHDVADQLKAKGMSVERVLPVTGVISGSTAPSKVAALKKVTGVMSVEEEVTAPLPAPDSPLQ
jgi:hypothetical protein